MNNFRLSIVVIVAAVVGVILFIVAFNAAQEAFKLVIVKKEDLFTITGRFHFSERKEGQLWKPKQFVYVNLEGYTASFIINNKSATLNASLFDKAVDTSFVRATIPMNALGLLQTRAEIKLYELSATNGAQLFSFAEALKRDKTSRFHLYLQAAICFLGGLVLLIVPKRYLVKQ